MSSKHRKPPVEEESGTESESESKSESSSSTTAPNAYVRFVNGDLVISPVDGAIPGLQQASSSKPKAAKAEANGDSLSTSASRARLSAARKKRCQEVAADNRAKQIRGSVMVTRESVRFQKGERTRIDGYTNVDITGLNSADKDMMWLSPKTQYAPDGFAAPFATIEEVRDYHSQCAKYCGGPCRGDLRAAKPSENSTWSDYACGKPELLQNAYQASLYYASDVQADNMCVIFPKREWFQNRKRQFESSTLYSPLRQQDDDTLVCPAPAGCLLMGYNSDGTAETITLPVRAAKRAFAKLSLRYFVYDNPGVKRLEKDVADGHNFNLTGSFAHGMAVVDEKTVQAWLDDDNAPFSHENVLAVALAGLTKVLDTYTDDRGNIVDTPSLLADTSSEPVPFDKEKSIKHRERVIPKKRAKGERKAAGKRGAGKRGADKGEDADTSKGKKRSGRGAGAKKRSKKEEEADGAEAQEEESSKKRKRSTAVTRKRDTQKAPAKRGRARRIQHTEEEEAEEETPQPAEEEDETLQLPSDELSAYGSAAE